MNSDALRGLQAPLKEKYKSDPDAARQTLSATGRLATEGLDCIVKTHGGNTPAGLHPATGGDGSRACSAEMLLEALIGCAGVTLSAVATAMEIPLNGGTITAEGDLDFRGTLGVSKEAPVGLTRIRLKFAIESDAPAEKLDKLIELTERYCVVYQTLKHSPEIVVERS